MNNEIPQEIKYTLVFDEVAEKQTLDKIYENLESETGSHCQEVVESDVEELLP